MAPLHQTTFRLTDEDLAILEGAKEQLGLASRSEALRYLLRQWDGSTEILRALSKSKRRRSGRRRP